MSIPGIPYQVVDPVVTFRSGRCLDETLDGGQSFRWEKAGDEWRGSWLGYRVAVRLDGSGRLCWRPLGACDVDATALAVADYFAADVDFVEISDGLPWRSDPVLAAARAAFPDLRLLRQPLAEVVLGFLCSSNMRVDGIRRMMRSLAERFGEAGCGGFRALPTWERLARADVQELKACGLGYRAAFVSGTAARLTLDPGLLGRVREADYATAKSLLLGLPGVGSKVADCILLYSGLQLRAFPVDTWILRTLETRYGLAGWKPVQVLHFAQAHFGSAAGLAQQYLFAWERAGGGKDKDPAGRH